MRLEILNEKAMYAHIDCEDQTMEALKKYLVEVEDATKLLGEPYTEGYYLEHDDEGYDTNSVLSTTWTITAEQAELLKDK